MTIDKNKVSDLANYVAICSNTVQTINLLLDISKDENVESVLRILGEQIETITTLYEEIIADL